MVLRCWDAVIPLFLELVGLVSFKSEQRLSCETLLPFSGGLRLSRDAVTEGAGELQFIQGLLRARKSTRVASLHEILSHLLEPGSLVNAQERAETCSDTKWQSLPSAQVDPTPKLTNGF